MLASGFTKKASYFEKYQVSHQDPKGFTFRFTKKYFLSMKTGRKSIFQFRKVNIIFRLNVKVKSKIHISFL
jgi:hypothetical protein